MAFDFNSLKNDPQDKAKLINKTVQLGVPRERIRQLREPALEKNNWGLLFYYYFLDELLVRSYHHDSIPPIITSMIREPEDLLASMEIIAKLYDTYCKDYSDDIHRVLDIMQEIAPKNGK